MHTLKVDGCHGTFGAGDGGVGRVSAGGMGMGWGWDGGGRRASLLWTLIVQLGTGR